MVRHTRAVTLIARGAFALLSGTGASSWAEAHDKVGTNPELPTWVATDIFTADEKSALHVEDRAATLEMPDFRFDVMWNQNDGGVLAIRQQFDQIWNEADKYSAAIPLEQVMAKRASLVASFPRDQRMVHVHATAQLAGDGQTRLVVATCVVKPEVSFLQNRCQALWQNVTARDPLAQDLVLPPHLGLEISTSANRENADSGTVHPAGGVLYQSPNSSPAPPQKRPLWLIWIGAGILCIAFFLTTRNRQKVSKTDQP